MYKQSRPSSLDVCFSTWTRFEKVCSDLGSQSLNIALDFYVWRSVRLAQSAVW